jgi:hypothetical protein
LVDGVLNQSGPLVEFLNDGPFDGVILGWGSLSHVWDPAERAQLFQATGRHSPRAPIVASFLRRRPERIVSDRSGLRARMLSCEKRIAGWLYSGPDATFIGGQGFCHLFTDQEIHHLAADHGYVVERYETTPYPHALFAPITMAPPATGREDVAVCAAGVSKRVC